MSLTKPEFTKIMEKWLFDYLKENYSDDYNIEALVPSSNLSKLSNDSVKEIDGYSSFEFKPDVLGILSSKTDGEIKLVLLNRSTSAISLKEIGELQCYCRLAKPLLAFIASPKGLPEEVNLLLINEDMQKSILTYEKDSSIVAFRWDGNSKAIDKLSIFPIEKRDEF